MNEELLEGKEEEDIWALLDKKRLEDTQGFLSDAILTKQLDTVQNGSTNPVFKVIFKRIKSIWDMILEHGQIPQHKKIHITKVFGIWDLRIEKV